MINFKEILRTRQNSEEKKTADRLHIVVMVANEPLPGDWWDEHKHTHPTRRVEGCVGEDRGSVTDLQKFFAVAHFQCGIELANCEA